MNRTTGIVLARTLLLLLFAATIPSNAQWDLEESHTTANLRGIANTGGGAVWASGTSGTVLRSEDGGYLWQTCATPPGAEKLDFRGIQAFDENTAIVMSSGPGDQSRLYKTTDGCQTWKLLFTNPDKDGFWDALQLAPTSAGFSRVGWLIGDPVDGRLAIFLTEDKGDTWKRWAKGGLGWIDSPCSQRNATARKAESLFAASNQSLLFEGANSFNFLFVTGGSAGSRLFSADYSALDNSPHCKPYFEDRFLPLGGSDSSGAFAIAATDWLGVPTRLVIVGGDYTKPDEPARTAAHALLRAGSPPFASAFEVTPAQTPPHGYRSSVAYDFQQKLWITVGPNGTDISTDDGKNWRALKPSNGDSSDADKNWNALSLPFVVGPHGRIGRLRTITKEQRTSHSTP